MVEQIETLVKYIRLTTRAACAILGLILLVVTEGLAHPGIPVGLPDRDCLQVIAVRASTLIAEQDVDRLINGSTFPLWVKITFTLFVCFLLPVYVVEYGPSNLLWFSDIALLTTLVALWFESRLLSSMMAVGVLLPELLWNSSFFVRWLTGVRLSGLTDYMFDATKSRFLRGLSLFHVVLPACLVWMAYRLGYDPRAFLAQTLLAWIVLPVTFLVTDPSDNINWVYGLGNKPQTYLSPRLYLVLLMIAFPLFGLLANAHRAANGVSRT